MKYFDTAAYRNLHGVRSVLRHSNYLLSIILFFFLVGCADKPSAGGQAMAKVNGVEITKLQLKKEHELQDLPGFQQGQASPQLLEALIDRQLLLNEAVREKMDRDPDVIQAIERAKGVIIAQAYMQKHLRLIAKPSRVDVEKYYDENPQLFSRRKQFDIRQLVLVEPISGETIKDVMNRAKSLDEAENWLKANNIKFGRGQTTRTSADLPPELLSKLDTVPVGSLFVINQGERSTLASLAAVDEVPIDLEAAAPQIERYLSAVKSREAGIAEVRRLRALAEIEYLNKTAVGDKQALRTSEAQ